MDREWSTYFSGLRATWRWMIVIAMLTTAFLVRQSVGALLDLYVLFFFPILFAAWFLGRKEGLIIAALSCMSWLYSDLTLRASDPLWATLTNSATRIAVYVAVAWGVSEMRILTERLATLSLTDELTGLANRRAFLARGELEILRMRRDQTPLSLMFIDLDDFKAVNDARGHDAGDTLLRTVGQILRCHVRATDFAARLGGDEFSIIFPDSDGEAVVQLATKIREAVSAALDHSTPKISLSIGIATFNKVDLSLESALHLADMLMYRVKNSGKNATLQQNIGD